MKIAISGKGGVGKTLLSALLARTFAEAGYSVIAIDADPDANLASSLGFPHPEDIVPLSELSDLIEERTGAKPGQSAPFYTLNPRVDDIPDKYSARHDGIKLMVMGRIKRGGTGCYCPEGSLLQALLSHLLVYRDEVVILDMEAGIEHLARGTSKSVDRLIIVVEPGRRSIETAQTIQKLARDLGIKKLALVANKIRQASDEEFIKTSLPDIEILGFLPYDKAITEADLGNRSLFDASPTITGAVNKIYNMLAAEPAGQSK